MKSVYLDNASTTAVDRQVFAAMRPYFIKKYGNASALHHLGQESKAGLERARNQIAQFLGVKPSEIIFTGSATESINLAHKGLVEAAGFYSSGKPHIITSSIEHKAVLETCTHLNRLGLAEATFVPVDHYGQIAVSEVEKAVSDTTVLISVMFVNNEVGTIQPISELGTLVKRLNKKRLAEGKQQIYLHTDATQAIQYLNCNVNELGVDLLSFTGHKIYAPKGIGVLYVRQGVGIKSQQDGGGQEIGMRSGTENVPYIVALGQAVKMIDFSLSGKIKKLQDYLITEVLKISGIHLTGDPVKRAPHIASFVVEGVEGEAMVLLLSDKGVMVSTGSACTSHNLQASHVLTAMGIAPEISHGSIRLSLGKNTTKEEIDYFLQVFQEVVADLRRMAPDFGGKT